MTYEIIDARPVRRDTAKIALCKTGNSYTPFATWYMREDGLALSGDYFTTFDEAVDGYRERCRQHRCK